MAITDLKSETDGLILPLFSSGNLPTVTVTVAKTYLSLLHEFLPGKSDLVALGVNGGSMVGVYGGQTRCLAVQGRYLVF